MSSTERFEHAVLDRGKVSQNTRECFYGSVQDSFGSGRKEIAGE